ncbi:Methionine aminopeptidase [compost metagenome]
MLLVPGLIFTIEPALNLGSADIYTSQQDGWTIYTSDKMPSAQWESMVLVTDEGCEVLAN